jgi:large subunit ribosomal protein L25
LFTATVRTPCPIHVEEKLLIKMLHTGHFMNSVVMIDVGGKQTRTLPKDVQFHPVTDRPLHVDFLRIAEHAQVHVNVPIRFVGDEESRGIKRGGVLNQVRHDLELVCDAAEIPDEIVISLAGLDIGDSLHISAVTLPQGATSAITDRDFTIATIVAPSGMSTSDAGDDVPADEVFRTMVPAAKSRPFLRPRPRTDRFVLPALARLLPRSTAGGGAGPAAGRS